MVFLMNFTNVTKKRCEKIRNFVINYKYSIIFQKLIIYRVDTK